MTFYPVPAFHFAVAVLGEGSSASAQPPAIDASFQEVSGLNAEIDFEEVAEGGENRFVHRLPKAVKYRNLVLKRGVVNTKSDLADWFSKTMGASLAEPVETRNVEIQLRGSDGSPLFVWAVYGAYPAKWETAPMQSEENRILVETLELAFTYFERRDGTSAPKQTA